MATTGVVGGSQIDVQSLAAQLTAAERATPAARIARDTSRVTTQLSALGQLMGSMSNFRSALTSLSSVEAFGVRSATSADPTRFSASAAVTAVAGSYDIEVLQLAKAQQLSSNPFAAGSAANVGTGTLTLSLGSANFSLEISDTNSTLAGIRDAINAASDNPGVRATLVTGSDGARLVLSSAHTGADNTLTVAQSGGDGGLAQIAYSTLAPANYSEITPPQDAIVNIANAQTTSASNTINGAIDGVTLNLTAVTDVDTPVSLTIGYDAAKVTERIEKFVSGYNALATQIAKLRSYDPTTRVAGPMLGDALLSSLESELRRTLTDTVDGQAAGFETLASIGITTQRDGTLGLDATKVQNALNSNFDAVAKLFGSEDGVASRLASNIGDRLASGSGIDARNKLLVKRQIGIGKQQADLDARMAIVQQAYIKQFTRLDTLLSQLQVTSSYMSQQIESLANMNK